MPFVSTLAMLASLGLCAMRLPGAGHCERSPGLGHKSPRLRRLALNLRFMAWYGRVRCASQARSANRIHHVRPAKDEHFLKTRGAMIAAAAGEDLVTAGRAVDRLMASYDSTGHSGVTQRYAALTASAGLATRRFVFTLTGAPLANRHGLGSKKRGPTAGELGALFEVRPRMHRRTSIPLRRQRQTMPTRGVERFATACVANAKIARRTDTLAAACLLQNAHGDPPRFCALGGAILSAPGLAVV